MAFESLFKCELLNLLSRRTQTVPDEFRKAAEQWLAKLNSVMREISAGFAEFLGSHYRIGLQILPCQSAAR
jgi:hypothetical protein